tara:strand:+ start:482 stop:733 length:252 start_codon:yes stop_codon:yes gene_type:complete
MAAGDGDIHRLTRKTSYSQGIDRRSPTQCKSLHRLWKTCECEQYFSTEMLAASRLSSIKAKSQRKLNTAAGDNSPQCSTNFKE